MALTKVTKSGLADDSVDASKLEDGTIVAADINDGTITNAKLAGSIANAKLANSSITVNGSAVALGGSITSQHIDWQSVVTSNTTMVSGKGYFVNTTGGAITMTLPASPSAGDYVAIKDYAATFQTNALTIARNGSNIQGLANDSELTTTRASVVLVYADATKGWLYTNESNVDVLYSTYISATGGTTSTTGDYKIHTFNSSSNFVVASVGNSTGSPAASKNTLDYLVVAGGGGGGYYAGAGGGAGGYRESSGNTGSYTASPTATPTGISVTAQTYPITVGAGGASTPSSVNNTPNVAPSGSNSSFSTITAAGGGGGGGGVSTSNGANGGSGGGGARYNSGSEGGGGTGNTPPVSPPQGNDGGNSCSSNGGGGGGATQAGSIRNGGNGASSEITGSAVSRAGGGGAYNGGTGGTGGGGAYATSGSANTGGGAGGDTNAGAGGSGVVILRYKYQN